jgi:hypothetical protein
VLSTGLDIATYAQRIKNKSGKARKTPARPAAKARPATAPKAEPAAAPSAELQGLKDELRRVNQEISRLARLSRPDAGRQSNLPEKQELLRQKVDLERKVRTRPNA